MTLNLALSTIGYVTGGGAATYVRFQFDDSDPFTINITFDEKGDRQILWCVGRELISLAVQQPQGEYGDGDVTFKSNDATFDIRLHSLDGTATIMFVRQEVRRFMRKVDKKLPVSSASAIIQQQLDRTIGNLLD